MKKPFHKLIPQWLSDMDNALLVRFPLLWASRLTYTLTISLALLLVNCAIATFIRVDITHIPDTSPILIYGSVICCVLGALWCYFQAMINLRYYHGKTRRLYDPGVVLLFVFQLALYASPIIFSYSILYERVQKVVADPKLSPVSYVVDVGREVNVGEDSVLLGSLSFENLIDPRAHISLPAKLYSLLHHSIKKIDFHDSTAELTYSFDTTRVDILILTHPVSTLVHSSFFGVDVTIMKYATRYKGSDITDTFTIASYFDPITQKTNFIEGDHLHDHLVYLKIDRGVRARNPRASGTDIDEKTRQVARNLNSIIELTPMELLGTLIIVILIGSYFVIIYMSLIRLFALKTVVKGLLIPLVLIGVIIYFTDNLGPDMDPKVLLFGHLLFMLLIFFLFFIIKKRRFLSLTLMQFLILLVPLSILIVSSLARNIPSGNSDHAHLNVVIPSKQEDIDTQIILALMSILPLVFLFLLIPMCTYRLYRIYCRPV